MKIGRTTLTKTLALRLSDANLPKELAAYLISERRTHELNSLLRDLEQYRADQNGIVEVNAVSAHDLTAAVRADIERTIRAAYPAAKQIMIHETIDADVVGGIRLELANQQLDTTVRTKLNRFKQLTAVGEN
jgi:F-type H+-transporting ATPase subunit delta